MATTNFEMAQTLAEREYGAFLNEYGFRLVLDHESELFSCTAFSNEKIQLAFTYTAHDGENLTIATANSPMTPDNIKNRTDGWRLVGGVWCNFYEEFHKERKELPYPHRLERCLEIQIIDRALRTLVVMIDSGEVRVA